LSIKERPCLNLIDTVISIAALGVAADLDRKQMAFMCNLAGGQVCETVGVTPINKATLVKDVKQYKSKKWSNILMSN